MKKVDRQGNKFIIIFKCTDNMDFRETLEGVKSLDNRRFYPMAKYWEAEASAKNEDRLRAMGFEFTAKADRPEKPMITIPISTLPPAPIEKMYNAERVKPYLDKLPGFKNYQLEGVLFVDDQDGRALIADEMGLGKTIQALGFLKLHPEAFPAIIVTPASVKLQWRDEIRKWIGSSPTIEILEGETPILHNFCDLTILNYDIISYWIPALEVVNFKTIIGDEVQKLANPEAKRTQAFKQLASGIKNRILLSGTPIKNRTKEFYTALSIIAPEEFKSAYQFYHRYCDPKLKTIHIRGGGTRTVWTFDGSTNWEELHQKLKRVMIRRTKAEVLPELPKKQKILVPLSSEKEAFRDYLLAESDFSKWVEREEAADKAQQTLHIEHLKQLAYLCKRKAVLSWLQDYIETDEKLVVITHHKAVIKDLSEAFNGKCVVVDGSTKDKEVERKRFWEDSRIRLFIGQIQAAGAGLNLQCASAVAFVEFPWTAADAEQAEDRVHRIGQEADSVRAYYLIAEGTIDLRIAQILTQKNKLSKRLLDGQQEAQFFGAENILEELVFGGKK